MKQLWMAASASCLLLAASVSAYAQQQNQQQDQPGKAGEVGRPLEAKDFVAKAMSSNKEEIELAEMAKERASNPKVKELAEKIITDHQKAMKKLKDQADELRIGVATGVKPEIRETKDRLSKLQGESFDKEFLQVMVNRHKKGIQMYEAQLKGENREVQTYARETLPTLRQHLKHAQQLLGNNTKDNGRN